ncbi:MAG: PorT family protein [Bacteroidales bacterium]|nr:PorT family protein [Bacteroidales bacterium]
MKKILFLIAFLVISTSSLFAQEAYLMFGGTMSNMLYDSKRISNPLIGGIYGVKAWLGIDTDKATSTFSTGIIFVQNKWNINMMDFPNQNNTDENYKIKITYLQIPLSFPIFDLYTSYNDGDFFINIGCYYGRAINSKCKNGDFKIFGNEPNDLNLKKNDFGLQIAATSLNEAFDFSIVCQYGLVNILKNSDKQLHNFAVLLNIAYNPFWF